MEMVVLATTEPHFSKKLLSMANVHVLGPFLSCDSVSDSGLGLFSCLDCL